MRITSTERKHKFRFYDSLTACKKKHHEKGKANLNNDETIDDFVSGSCLL